MTRNGSYAEELSGVSPAVRQPVRRPLSPAEQAAALDRLAEARRQEERRAAAAKHEHDTDVATAREAFPEVWSAAELLGARPSEIVAVREQAEGLVVEWVNSAPTVIVPEDRPDADGKTGVMCLNPNPVLPFYARTPTVVEVPEVEPEPEPVREPWADLVDEDPVVVSLRPIVEAYEAEIAALWSDPRYPPDRNQLRRPTEQLEAARLLVARRTSAIKVEWEQAHPAPPDESEVERMAAVYVVATLMDRVTSNRERKLVERRYIDGDGRVGYLRSPLAGFQVEADAAEGWLRSAGVDLPAVPTFEDLERDAAGAPAPLTLDELVDLDAGDAA